jgi:hypothetical protein
MWKNRGRFREGRRVLKHKIACRERCRESESYRDTNTEKNGCKREARRLFYLERCKEKQRNEEEREQKRGRENWK